MEIKRHEKRQAGTALAPAGGSVAKSALASPVPGTARYTSREWFTGAWQRPVQVDETRAQSYFAVFACMTLIAGDIAKLRLKQVKRGRGKGGVWSEVEPGRVQAVLVKPNHYQTRIQFFENWFLSKLSRGNAYIFKQYGAGGQVEALHVLDPTRVRPLVAPDGSVFYELQPDNLIGHGEAVTVPARFIIHDRFNCLFHPLVGLSPLFAAGLASVQGLEMQQSSARLFQNGGMPSGILTAPGDITETDAAEIKAAWQAEYGGSNRGKTAVLGHDMKFVAVQISSADAQMIEQLRWTAEVVCSVFHVPAYKAGIGATPSYNNVEALNVEYFTQALQGLIEAAELCLDEGLGFQPGAGTEFDVSGLMRMDSAGLVNFVDKVRGVMTLDERRAILDLEPIKGGDTLYLQQQDHSLAAIEARDRRMIEGATVPAVPPDPAQAQADYLAEAARAFQKGMEA